MVKPKSIIFDGSNSLRYVKSWEQESLQGNMDLYWTREKGAYTFN